MSLSSMLVLFGCAASVLSYRLIQRQRTRSLYLVITALALLMSGHLLRLGMMARGAPPESFQVAAFTWNSNYLVLSTVLAMILISFGYWGYVLEKMRLKTLDVQAEQLAAEMLVHESQQLIKERDQLMMVNARVSAISSLSSFSAMLVHDISQPLQALEFGLYDLKTHATHGVSAEHLQRSIMALQVLSTKAGEMVSHLRQLMGQGQDHISPINPDQALQAILPILQGEAQQRGISLTYHAQLPESPCVMANAVMLQRIVLNTVGNALDALQHHAGAEKSVRIVLNPERHEQGKGLVLSIEDTGPGFEDDILSQLNSPIQTSKPKGMGLGLLLMQTMVRMWGGHTHIGNRARHLGTGGLIQIWLRSAATEDSF
jgi:C4-dicarboxylate-specific signal transduction histidine kinase